MRKIVTIIGTRPQYIKAAPVSLEISRHDDIHEAIVDTGQHFDYEMSEIFLEELHLPRPKYNLGINGKSHAQMTAAMLPPLEDILLDERPDTVLIYGDTNSSLSAALAASKLGIKIAHVEGGIRTSVWNPEEINRRVVDTLSDAIFCPTRSSWEQCAREDLAAEAHYVGDVMFDTLRLARDFKPREVDLLQTLGIADGGYVVLTIHRPENTGSLQDVLDILAFVREQAAGRPIIFPAHPRVDKLLSTVPEVTAGITVCKPLGYVDMARLAGRAAEIFTDSGGLQKEAYFHGVPSTVIYDDTPWPELREAGWLKLWKDSGFAPRKAVDDFGDGHAASKIVNILRAL